MKEKKDLLLDIDDVFCFPGYLNAVNDFMGTSYVIDDFTDYYIDEVAIPKERFHEFNEFLNGRNLYDDAQILPYAIETLEKLKEFYNIYPLSSCINPFDLMGSGKLFHNKYDFLLASLPFVRPENFIFTNAKHLCIGDVQIDDRLSNLHQGVGTRILFPSYHNKNISHEELMKKGVLRAGCDWREGWIEVGNILLPNQFFNNESNLCMKRVKEIDKF